MSPRMVLLFEFHFETEFFEFKFELNCLNQLLKKEEEETFPSLFSPAQTLSFFSLPQPNLSRPKTSPTRPSRRPLSRTGRQAGPARRARPLPPAQAGLQLRESRPRTPRHSLP